MSDLSTTTAATTAADGALSDLEAMVAELRSHDRFLLTAHEGPDGDALGSLLGRQERAVQISSSIEAVFRAFRGSMDNHEPVRTAYFIWRNPYMVAGHSTFINEMLALCGFSNVFTGLTSRYPEISSEELIAANPELVLLSSEPYPFREQHTGELKALLPGARIRIVDGELFSWYGSRLLRSPAYFRQLLEELRRA